MTTLYTYEVLKQMKGQAVKDIWHALIGKPAGLKNTTGLKNGEEIIQAILKGQIDPGFLQTFGGKTPKQKEETLPEPQVEMPPKKPGPKPKVQTVTTKAIESTDMPIAPTEVKKITVRKLHVDNQSYYYNPITFDIYTIEQGRPGRCLGIWDAESRTILEQA